jgi:hypothetical protein
MGVEEDGRAEVTMNAELRFFKKSLQDLFELRKKRMEQMINGIPATQLVGNSLVELIRMVQDYSDNHVKQDTFSIDFDPLRTRIVVEPTFESIGERTSFRFHLPYSGNPDVLEYRPEHVEPALAGVLQVGEDEVWLVYTTEQLDERDLRAWFAGDRARLEAVVRDLNGSIGRIDADVERGAYALVEARKQRAEKSIQLAQSLEEGLRNP